MLHNGNTVRAWIAISLWIIAVALPGCARLRLPAIDPTGERIFLPSPNGTSLLTPRAATTSDPSRPAVPIQPAFVRPADPASCCGNQPAGRRHGDRQFLIPNPSRNPTPGQLGEIILTPSRIIAPVGSEVVVLAGICGNDYHYVMNQPLEWMLSNDSVGQMVEVGGMEHSRFNNLVPPTSKKFDGNYAWGRTGLKTRLLTRGTPTPVDDIQLGKGQAYVSLSSASEGTSYVTCVAPKAQGWDKRRKSTVIHWVDALWAIPVPKTATAGTVTPLTTLVTRSSDNGGVAGWKVKYTIVGGAPAEFAPTGSQAVEVLTNEQGQAIVQLRQAAGQFDPGTTQVRVDVIRPPIFGQPELQVESGITSVDWSAPALSIRAIGPKAAGINEAFNYRVEVSNPGDQLTRDVVLRTKDFPDGLEFVSSTPKPSVFGRQLEWRLGDIEPGSQPSVVEIQLKSNQRGNNELCFEVSSEEDQLRTDACAQTEVSAPCIGLQVEGPNAGKVGDQVSFDIIIANQCDEPLENLQLEIQYDAGLSATNLGNPIRADVGTIQPGERKTMPVAFDIVAPGRHCYLLNVTADAGHTARATECIEASPSASAAINLELTGRRRIDRGDKVLIRGTATNNGNVALNNVTMTNRFSDSLEPSRVSELFPHRWLGNEADELLFELGTLNPGQSKAVEVIYDGLKVDGDAFSEMTISSPDLEPQTQRYDLRIEPTGTLGGTGGGPGDLEPQEPGGVPLEQQPGVPPIQNVPNEDPIAIPGDPQANDLNAQRNLVATAQALDRQIVVSGQARMQFEIENRSTVSDQNVNVSILVPPSLQLANVFDDAGNEIPIVSRSNDFTRFDLEPRREMRPGDKVTYIATFIGVQPGQPFVEVQAFSNNTAGMISARDTIAINPN